MEREEEETVVEERGLCRDKRGDVQGLRLLLLFFDVVVVVVVVVVVFTRRSFFSSR